ncbi:MAG: leucine-rich repeat domain-containing protein [Prevotellaceae bacterium]|nr:leucine-rich repeat domain-containing protein [Prevotellaceae bacterium]
MKKFFILLCLFGMISIGAGANVIPNTEIWYTTSDGEPIELRDKTVFGATYESNEYKDGKGVITFNGDVTTIGQGAFASCYNLTNIQIPKSVTSIGDAAFGGCSSLTSIEIPKSVTSIKFAAFSGCSALTGIEIPESVETIDEQAFNYTNLTSVYVGWTDADKIPDLSNECFPYETCNLYVPEGTTDIYSSKNYWKMFKSINVHIPFNQIWYTSSDAQPIEPADKTGFGAGYLSSTYNNGKGIITFDGDISTIGEKAFHECSNLTSVRIPESVTSIGSNAFSNCSGLVSIGSPKSLLSIGEMAFDNCSSLTSIEIPESVTSIEKYTFNSCQSLVSIILPESVTSIGDYAFFNCEKLASIVLPNSLKSIGWQAFFYCLSLASITLPESLESIGHMAFQGVGLKSVFVKWTAADEIPDLEEIQFPYTTCVLYIPYGTTKLYAEKEYWKSFKSIIEPHLHIVNTDNTVEDRYLKGGEALALNDDIKQIVTQGTVSDINLTYTRDFTLSAGNWQCWFVPFDAPLGILKENGIDAAEIAGILLNEKGETIVAFKKMTEGTLKANTPYVVRIGKNIENKNVNLEFEGLSLRATNETSFTNQSSYEDFKFTGNYASRHFNDCYTLNLNGVFQKMGEGVELRPMRFRLDISPRSGGPYSNPATSAKEFVDMTVFGDDEPMGITSYENPSTGSGRAQNDDENIYNLQGQKVTSIQSGQIYIINGKKYIAR